MTQFSRKNFRILIGLCKSAFMNCPIICPLIWRKCLQSKMKLFNFSTNAKNVVMTFFATVFFEDSRCCCSSFRVNNVGVKGSDIYFYYVCFSWNIIDGFNFIEKVFCVSYISWNFSYNWL